MVGDWDLELRLLQSGDVVQVNKVLAQYRYWSTPQRQARILQHLDEVVRLYETTVAEILQHYPQLEVAARNARKRRALVWALQLGQLVDKGDFEQAARLITKIDNSTAVHLALKLQRSKVLSSLIAACVIGHHRLRQRVRALRDASR